LKKLGCDFGRTQAKGNSAAWVNAAPYPIQIFDRRSVIGMAQKGRKFIV
jgi:hypothetical protein